MSTAHKQQLVRALKKHPDYIRRVNEMKGAKQSAAASPQTAPPTQLTTVESAPEEDIGIEARRFALRKKKGLGTAGVSRQRLGARA